MIVLSLTLLCVTFPFVKPKIGLLDTAKNPFQYLEEQNYYYENHTVITEDGYKLSLVRIPYDRNDTSARDKYHKNETAKSARPPVLFVHGVFTSFYDFTITGPGVSFGFRAVEVGYDVFFLNTRGNRWSRKHVTLDPDLNGNKYWNFSWHELGIYDLPATIDYITNLTGYSNISYVGHSQGTTAFLVLASTKPNYNKKLKVAVLLSPVAYVGHAKFTLLVLLKHSARVVQAAVEALHINEILPYSPVIARLGQLICNRYSLLLPACKLFFYEMTGPTMQMNEFIIGTYFTNYPVGASVKQLLHFLLNAHSGEFRLYDYGKTRNVFQYGQPIPPDYNLTAISTPVALYYGASDYFVATQDARKLASKLPNVIRNVLVPYAETNHFDAVMGKKAPELFTEPSLKVLNEYNGLS